MDSGIIKEIIDKPLRGKLESVLLKNSIITSLSRVVEGEGPLKPRQPGS
jgi:hypothetical protein